MYLEIPTAIVYTYYLYTLQNTFLYFGLEFRKIRLCSDANYMIGIGCLAIDI